MSLENDISNFFSDLLNEDVSKKFKNIIFNDKKLKQKSNILYLTNQCNCNCEYCYQREERENSKIFFITESQVDDFFKNLYLKEPNSVSTIFLFGGEPFLNYNIIKYIFKVSNEYYEKYNKKFGISMVTNGLFFKDENNIFDFFKEVSKLKHRFSIEISYDGSGHFRRKTKSGKSTSEDVKEVIKKLLDYNIRFRISYTIHSGNYKNVLQDLIKLSKLNVERIIVNFYEEELQNFIDVENFKETLKLQTLELYKHFRKPICFLNCEYCKKCNFESFNGNNYTINNKSFNHDNIEKFNHFKENI